MAKKKKESVAVRLTAADKGFNITVNTLMTILLVIIVIPLWCTITMSFRPNDYLGSYIQGMFMAPWHWSFSAYNALLGNNGFLIAFSNSLKILVFGVATALFLTIPLAYGLSVKDLRGRSIISIFIIVPYVFNVGVVPTYILIAKLGLRNHLFSVFAPVAISTYNCLIM